MRCLLLVGLLMFAAAAPAQDEHFVKLFEVNQRFAQAGSKEGQFKLAEMYEQGLGTPADLEKARFWYEQAAGQGHEEAAARVADWEARQAARRQQAEQVLARKRAEAQKAREAAQRRAEAEQRAQLEAQQRAEKERAEKAAAQKRAEAQKALAAKKRVEQEKARLAAQRRVEEEKAHAPAQPEPAAVPVAATAPEPSPASPPSSEAPKDESAANFETNPCKTAAARFMSTCRKD